MSRGARVWRRVVGAFASEKPRFRSAHLWTLVKYILVPRGRESSAAVRHVEARPAGAALLGEVRISSRQRAPALVARPLRSLLAGQVVTPRPGRGDTRAYRVVRHLLGDRKMLHEPRGDALLAKCPRRSGQILFSHKPRLHPLQTTTFPDSIVHTPVYKQEGRGKTLVWVFCQTHPDWVVHRSGTANISRSNHIITFSSRVHVRV